MTASLPRVIVFDLDDTLAPSKSPVEPRIAQALVGLLARLPVGITSGARFEQFQTQVLDHLIASEEQLGRLHLMPTCGTRYYTRRHRAWAMVYATDLTAPDKTRIADALEDAARRHGYWATTPWGALIEDHGSQVTYSVLGQAAPPAAKAAWGPAGAKKRTLVAEVSRLLPDLEVRGGGSASIDVTGKGIDKGYGMRRLMSVLRSQEDQLVFVGDRLDDAGNDHPVLALGVACVAVTSWRDALTVIFGLIHWRDGDGVSPEYVGAPTASLSGAVPTTSRADAPRGVTVTSSYGSASGTVACATGWIRSTAVTLSSECDRRAELPTPPARAVVDGVGEAAGPARRQKLRHGFR